MAISGKCVSWSTLVLLFRGVRRSVRHPGWIRTIARAKLSSTRGSPRRLRPRCRPTSRRKRAATKSGGVVRLDGGGPERLVAPEMDTDAFQVLTEDASGQLYVATLAGLMLVRDDGVEPYSSSREYGPPRWCISPCRGPSTPPMVDQA